MIRKISSVVRLRIAIPVFAFSFVIATPISATSTYIPYSYLMQNFEWTYGCTPTAASMVLSYWDHFANGVKYVGYGRLLKYYLNAPCSNKNVPNTLRELKHEMSTDYDIYHCSGDGTTDWSNVADGIKTVTNDANGYSFVSKSICSATWPQIVGDWCWGDMKSEIDAGRPFLWNTNHVNFIGLPGHSVAAFGYTDEKYVILDDTWGGQRNWYYTNWIDTEDSIEHVQVNQVAPGGALEDDITLDDPMGDETLTAGGKYRIHWYQWGTTIQTVVIEYSTDQGNSWSPVATVPGTHVHGWYHYDWLVPNTPVEKGARIRLTAYHANGGMIAGDGSLDNFTIQPPCADLVVQSIATSPVSPMAGQPVNVTVTVKNQGTCTATPTPPGASDSFIVVAFYKNRDSAPSPSDWGDLEDGLVLNNAAAEIPPDGTATLTGQVTFGYTGTFHMWAQVDTDGRVPETNESNNVFGPQTITVVADDKPTGSIAINGGAWYANSRNVTLTLTCTDLGSGCDTMQFLQDCGGGQWTFPERFATTRAWTWLCEMPLYVRFYDRNGNWSQYHAEIIVDTDPPSGSIAINGGAASTTSPAVTLTLACTDSISHCASMCLSNDNAHWSAWQAVSPSRPWNLTAGEGPKSVYVQYKDNAGNVSGSLGANILFQAGPGDIDADGDVDQNDVNIVVSFRGRPASACPKCDLDGDGQITALDARKLVLLCTRPNCAP